LAEAGATVYITGRTLSALADQPGSLDTTAAAIAESGGIAVPVQVDHGDDEQVKALFDRIETEQAGRLDLLVNNAYSGVAALKAAYGNPFWESDPSTFWDACNQVGLRSHYLASVYAARLMVPRRQGLICTLSSWGGLSYIFGVPYGVGKAACDRMAADMAVELKPHGVTSLSIWPGIVGTELMTQFADEMGLSDAPSENSLPPLQLGNPAAHRTRNCRPGC
jgi:NAD(P)-dependent dehydrogenase (short-subunit alcohol dehydrogenase family)